MWLLRANKRFIPRRVTFQLGVNGQIDGHGDGVGGDGGGDGTGVGRLNLGGNGGGGGGGNPSIEVRITDTRDLAAAIINQRTVPCGCC